MEHGALPPTGLFQKKKFTVKTAKCNVLHKFTAKVLANLATPNAATKQDLYITNTAFCKGNSKYALLSE